MIELEERAKRYADRTWNSVRRRIIAYKGFKAGWRAKAREVKK